MINTRTSFTLSDITCLACEKIISKKLRTISDVEEIITDIQTGIVTLIGTRKIILEEVIVALKDTHYKVITNSY